MRKFTLSACRELVAVILGVRKDDRFPVFCFEGYPFSYLERYQKLQIFNATDIAVFNAWLVPSFAKNCAKYPCNWIIVFISASQVERFLNYGLIWTKLQIISVSITLLPLLVLGTAGNVTKSLEVAWPFPAAT